MLSSGGSFLQPITNINKSQKFKLYNQVYTIQKHWKHMKHLYDDVHLLYSKSKAILYIFNGTTDRFIWNYIKVMAVDKLRHFKFDTRFGFSV